MANKAKFKKCVGIAILSHKKSEKMFWIVTWPTSHRFRDKRRFSSKIADFSYPRVFSAPAEGVPLNWV